MRRLIVYSLAERELGDAFAWTQRHYPASIVEFADEIRGALASLLEAPLWWAPWRSSSYRRCLLPRLPYSFFYSVDERVVHIVAFVHQHRDATRRLREVP